VRGGLARPCVGNVRAEGETPGASLFHSQNKKWAAQSPPPPLTTTTGDSFSAGRTIESTGNKRPGSGEYARDQCVVGWRRARVSVKFHEAVLLHGSKRRARPGAFIPAPFLAGALRHPFRRTPDRRRKRGPPQAPATSPTRRPRTRSRPGSPAAEDQRSQCPAGQ
jgi:hypothetical protein